MKKNKNFNHYYNNRRNTPKKTLADITVAVYDDLGLDRVGKDLKIIYEKISKKDVLTNNISTTESVLSQIEANKCYHLNVLPLVEYGKDTNTPMLKKYLAKVILKHPEYLYYIRPIGHSVYGLQGKEPGMFAAVNSKIAFSYYCEMWECEKYIHPHKIIAQLKEFLIRIGYTEENADIFIESCIDGD